MSTNWEGGGGADYPKLESFMVKKMRKRGVEQSLFSIAFIPPGTLELDDVRNNFAYYNIRSGIDWDLYLAGYSVYSNRRTGQPRKHLKFNPSSFDRIITDVRLAQNAALRTSDKPPNLAPWKYSGRCELVSMMAYCGAGIYVDWLSLRAVTIQSASKSGSNYTFGEVTETLSDWRLEPALLQEIGPGEFNAEHPLFALRSILAARPGRADRLWSAAVRQRRYLARHGSAAPGIRPGHRARHLDPRPLRQHRGAQLATRRAALITGDRQPSTGPADRSGR